MKFSSLSELEQFFCVVVVIMSSLNIHNSKKGEKSFLSGRYSEICFVFALKTIGEDVYI